MLAIASGEIRESAGPMLQPAFAAPRWSVGSAIRHGLVVGAAATIVQVLLLLALLYACGVIAS
jgi:hypothetical protein